jgi:hypothetical protein
MNFLLFNTQHSNQITSNQKHDLTQTQSPAGIDRDFRTQDIVPSRKIDFATPRYRRRIHTQ